MSVDAELAERVRDELMGEARLAEKAMKGWILVDQAGFETETELNAWVRQGVEFARALPAKR